MINHTFDYYHRLTVTYPSGNMEIVQYKVDAGFLWHDDDGGLYEQQSFVIFTMMLRYEDENYKKIHVISHPTTILPSGEYDSMETIIEYLSGRFDGHNMYAAQLVLMAISMRYNCGYGFYDGQEIRIIHYKED